MPAPLCWGPSEALQGSRDVLGAPGWWSLLPKHPLAAAMTQLPASMCPATMHPPVPRKEQRLLPLTGQDVTPRCRAGTPVPPPWQQQTPWGFPLTLPFPLGLRTLTAFSPSSVSWGKKKKKRIWSNLLAPGSSSHPASPGAITEMGFKIKCCRK